MRYVHSAMHICVFTAFSEYPQNALILRCCLIHLKNSSICQRFFYKSAMDSADAVVLFVKNTYTWPSGARYLMRRNVSG